MRTVLCEMDAHFTQGKESATERIPPFGMAATPIPQGKGEKVR
jgi:hypothetical protein